MTHRMKEIDVAFRKASGILERRYYKIYYSHIHPFPLLVLGQNPGGETDGTDLSASDTYFENWEHDYVCFRNNSQYTLAKPMCDLLSAVLQTNSVDVLRQIPATNLIFRRSRDTKSLDLSTDKAAAESAPFLRQIIEIVNPCAILIISSTAYKLFKKFHCEHGSVIEAGAPKVFTPNGKSNACIYLSAQARVIGLNRMVPLLITGHPSKYSGRSEWPQVLGALGQGLQDCNVAPINNSSLVSIKPIRCYGTHL